MLEFFEPNEADRNRRLREGDRNEESRQIKQTLSDAFERVVTMQETYDLEIIDLKGEIAELKQQLEEEKKKAKKE